MKRIKVAFMLAALAAMVLAACAPQAGQMDDTMQEEAAMATHTPDAMMAETPDDMMAETPDDAMMEDTHDDTMMEETPDAMMAETPEDTMMEDTHDDMMAETPEDSMMDDTSDDMMDDTMMEAPAWLDVQLTNAATGENFTVGDFSGKVVLLETMAQWCTNCMQQQREVLRLHELMGMNDDLISLGVDIDPNEDLATLKTYIEKNGFDWTYTVAPAEMSNDLADLYGDQFLNPPSTPMLIVDRAGAVHPLPFGIKSAEDLQKALEPFLSEGM